MSSLAFDALKTVETLEAVGFDRRQANAIVVAVRSAQDAGDVATKGDLREIKAEMRELKAEMRAEMRELELRLLIKFGSMLAVVAGVIIAAIKM